LIPGENPDEAEDRVHPLVRRSFRATCQFAAVAAIFASAALTLLYLLDHPIVYGAFALCGIGALLFGTAAVYATWRAPCPSCAQPMAFLAPDQSRSLCRSCGSFAESRAGRAVLLPESYVAEEPLFTVRLRFGTQLPARCAACGERASRTVALRVGPRGGGLASTVTAARVPHCAEHENGAILASESRTALLLAVRSYRFLRDYRALNEAERESGR
jgi:hypothetical protein